jgi:hypothetical protein
MICTHRVNPGCRISRFLVALPPVRDLLLRANYLFAPAMMASAPYWGAGAADCVSMRAERICEERGANSADHRGAVPTGF